ncbi:acetyltransferase [bacterium]|nr:acetyltransferase [bacterium]
MDAIIIVGSSGHAKVIVDIIEQEGCYRIAGFLEKEQSKIIQSFGYQVLGQESNLPQLVQQYDLKGIIVAIGDNYIRSRVASQIETITPLLPFITAIHPRASIARNVTIAAGSVIMAGVSINPDCSIGKHCILNTNSSLDHDSVMCDFSSLGPGVTTGGNCIIGNHSAIGIGAVLSHNISIGQHTLVGAGSTVIGNVGDYCVAFGSPAKPIRSRRAGEKYL